MNLIQQLAKKYFSRQAMPYWVVLLLDCAFVFASALIGALIQEGKGNFYTELNHVINGAVFTVLVFVVSFHAFKTYLGIIRYSSFSDLARITFANLVASIAIGVLSFLINSKYLLLVKFEGGLIIFLFSTTLMCFMRIAVKVIFEKMRVDANTKRVFIYGIREGGVSMAKAVQSESPRRYTLAGFIAPEGDFNTNILMGVKVFPEKSDIVSEMIKRQASTLLISPLQREVFKNNQELIDALIKAGIKIKIQPKPTNWTDSENNAPANLKDIDIEDLLPREAININMNLIEKELKGKVIFITGAAGSIGSEMVKQIAMFEPKELILLDQAETPMHDVRLMMEKEYPNIKTQTIVGNIRNKELIDKLFSQSRPEYVFHAAAYKHVPMMEDNPGIAVQNNIYGTRVIADLSVKYGVKKFVMISTDKAVNPTNVMGCSKRICEIYCQALNGAIEKGEVQGCTQFITTRFGNVLGSNGSVIPIFKKQIANGGPVTVTSPDIIRYFMLIPEACKLVLDAGVMGKGGEIFIFDMGQPVKIADLAARMIALSEAKNVKIEYTGLREGEKLYEELLADQENTLPTDNPKIRIAKVRECDYKLALKNEDKLLEISKTFDDFAIVKCMKEIVPEYKSAESRFCALDN